MTQPNFLDPSGPVGLQVEWQSYSGQQRSVLGSPGSTLLAADPNVRYVTKGGSDATGNGSILAPYLTIQAAITSAAAAPASSSNPITVRVSPGIWTDPFLLEPFVYVHGLDPNDTILSPTQANWISANFAAGTQDTGISNCTIRSALIIDFSLVASAGAATAQLRSIIMGTGSSIALTGNNVNNAFQLSTIVSIAVSTSLTLSNCSSLIDGVHTRNGNVTFNGNDGYQTVHRCGTISSGGTLTVASTGVTASLIVAIDNPGFLLNPVITGARAQLTAPGYRVQQAAPNANTTFSFGNLPNGGTVILPCAGDIFLAVTPGIGLTYTFERGDGGATTPTSITIMNNSANAITIAFAAGASGSAGSAVTIAALSMTRFYNLASVWQVALG